MLELVIKNKKEKEIQRKRTMEGMGNEQVMT